MERAPGGISAPHSIWTSRKSYRVEFPGEGGNRIYLCLRYENGKGGSGPWSPVLTAIIP